MGRTASTGRAESAAWAVVVLLLLLLFVAPVHAHAEAPRAASARVLSLYQSSYVPEQGNFSVYLEVANVTAVQFAYFTFCQLSSPLCYKPVAMAHSVGNWLVGTTNPMSTYHGMTVGVRAGYNVTIEYANNTNLTEPAMPSPFSNLTVAQSVTGEYMFQMTVMNQVFGLNGVVTDSATGRILPGATVTVSPGIGSTTTGSTGGYSFAGLPNGSYTLSASAPGYRAVSQSLAIDGTNAVKDIALANMSAVTVPPGGSGGTSFAGAASSFATSPLGLGILALIVVGLAVAVYRGRRSGKATPPPAAKPPTDGESPSPKKE